MKIVKQGDDYSKTATLQGLNTMNYTVTVRMGVDGGMGEFKYEEVCKFE